MTVDRAERRRRNRAQAKVVAAVLLRTVATAAVLGALYYLTPVRAKTQTQEVLWLRVSIRSKVLTSWSFTRPEK